MLIAITPLLNLKQETSKRNEVDTFDPHFDWTDVHQLSIWQEETSTPYH